MGARQAGDPVLQVHLSGGEPTARGDLAAIVRGCAGTGLYSNLITAGAGVTRERLQELADAGLDHVQLSSRAPTRRPPTRYPGGAAEAG
jgi:pyrroloquinoline quinone biosynthesis protein E